MDYTLNDKLDAKALAKQFKKAGRLRVAGALDEKSADGLSETIEKMAVWRWTFLDGEEERIVSGPDMRSKTGRRQRELTEQVFLQARDGFTYLLFDCPIDNIPDANEPKALADADAFFGGEKFRDFLRAVAGEKEGEIDHLRARWLSGEQFMGDTGTATSRPDCKLYFVMDLTRNWRSHWGGQLNFLDTDGGIEEAWSPDFNSLKIYPGDARHSISCVAPFNGALALSVCGRLV